MRRFCNAGATEGERGDHAVSSGASRSSGDLGRRWRRPRIVGLPVTPVNSGQRREAARDQPPPVPQVLESLQVASGASRLACRKRFRDRDRRRSRSSGAGRSFSSASAERETARFVAMIVSAGFRGSGAARLREFPVPSGLGIDREESGRRRTFTSRDRTAGGRAAGCTVDCAPRNAYAGRDERRRREHREAPREPEGAGSVLGRNEWEK